MTGLAVALLVILGSGPIYAEDVEWLTPQKRTKIPQDQWESLECRLAYPIKKGSQGRLRDTAGGIVVISTAVTDFSGFILLADYAYLMSPNQEKKIVFSWDEASTTRISVVRKKVGDPCRVVCPGREVNNVSWFPDNSRIAYTQTSVYGAPAGVWIWNPETGENLRLIKPRRWSKELMGYSDGFLGLGVSPTGEYLWYVYQTNCGSESSELWITDTKGKSPRKLAGPRPDTNWKPLWSKDGNRVILHDNVFTID